MANKEQVLPSMDYVYTPKKNADKDDEQGNTKLFENVHVDFNLSNEKLEIVVSSEKPIEQDDLEDIIIYIQTSRLKKPKINLIHDCIVVLRVKEKNYDVIFDSDVIKIGEIKEKL